MSRTKFQFNTETLQYERQSDSAYRRWGRLTLHVLISACLGLGLMLGYSALFNTPRSHALRKASHELQVELSMLQDQVRTSMEQLSVMEHRDNNKYRLIFEADSIPYSVRQGGVGGVEEYASFDRLEHGELLAQLARSIDNLSWRTYIQSRSFDDVTKLANDKDRMMRSMPAVQPVLLGGGVRISSQFGYRSDPFTRAGRMHTGLDFRGPIGTPIHATGDGIVVVAEYNAAGYGKNVVVDHGFGYKTLYAHLSRIGVEEGEHIKRGQVIGQMGSTGRSTGSHLHYEVMVNNVKVNPINYFTDLSDETYEEVLRHSAESPALD